MSISIRPATYVTQGLTASEIRYVANANRLTYDQVLNLIETVLNQTLNLTMLDLEIWIDKYVPKRTGQLRQNLKDNLQSSNVINGILRIILGTNIDYAKFVNDMSTFRVRHSGQKDYAYYYGEWGPVILDDPFAIGSFFIEMIKYAKERAMLNLAKVKSIYFTGMGYLGRMISTRLEK